MSSDSRAFDSKAVANRFLDIADAAKKPLCPMKLQKLTYFAHGWHLAFKDAPLINEMVEAWTYGPVVPSLYHEFKEFGRSPIDERATRSRLEGSKLKILTPTLEEGPADCLNFAKSLLDQVWTVYGKYSAFQLSNMTHAPGTPWHQIWQEHKGQLPRGIDIPQDRIRDYFKAKLANSAQHA